MMGDSKPSLPVYKLQGINDVSLKDIMKIAKEIFIPNNCAITLYGNVNSNKIQNGLKQCLDILNIN